MPYPQYETIFLIDGESGREGEEGEGEERERARIGVTDTQLGLFYWCVFFAYFTQVQLWLSCGLEDQSGGWRTEPFEGLMRT